MNFAFLSFNKTIRNHWAAIAPGSSVYIAEVDKGAPSADSLIIQWLNYGGATAQVQKLEAIIQLDVLAPNAAEALRRTSELEKQLGFTSGAGFGILGRYDYADKLLSEMEVRPVEAGWIPVNEGPNIVRLSRTIRLKYNV